MCWVSFLSPNIWKYKCQRESLVIYLPWEGAFTQGNISYRSLNYCTLHYNVIFMFYYIFLMDCFLLGQLHETFITDFTTTGSVMNDDVRKLSDVAFWHCSMKWQAAGCLLKFQLPFIYLNISAHYYINFQLLFQPIESVEVLRALFLRFYELHFFEKSLL